MHLANSCSSSSTHVKQHCLWEAFLDGPSRIAQIPGFSSNAQCFSCHIPATPAGPLLPPHSQGNVIIPGLAPRLR